MAGTASAMPIIQEAILIMDATIRYRNEPEHGHNLGAAYITTHGQLLCSSCVDRNKGQLSRAGVTFEVVPCHGIVECTLCGRSATEF